VIAVLQVVVFFGVPVAVTWASRRYPWVAAASPVVLCYVAGILFGNLAGLDAGAGPEPGALAPAEKLTNLIAGLGVILAMAALLVSTDFARWWRLAPVTLLSSILAMGSVVAVSSSLALVFRGAHPMLWAVSGMLTGVYTGGTVNLAAIARALQVDPVTWGVVHTSDVIICGVWYLLLLGIGPRLFGLFLRPTPRIEGPAGDLDADETARPIQLVQAAGIALGISLPPLLLSQAVVYWSASLEEPVAILGVTTFATVLSFWPRLRRVVGLVTVGDLLLLVFCTAVGSLATWSRLSQAEPFLFSFTLMVVVGSILLHSLLAWLFRVDRDTMVITHVAALYGPPFIPAVAKALGNREVVVGGVTSGLVGLAAGNFLGLAVAWAVR
jgi:uncharacterized membrane protein